MMNDGRVEGRDFWPTELTSDMLSGLAGLEMKTTQPSKKNTPLQKQVGGDHYKNYKVQPIEYSMANKLDHCQSNVVKYVTRFRDKNGIVDLKKAIHYLELLIVFEYGQETWDELVRGENEKRNQEKEPHCEGPSPS